MLNSLQNFKQIAKRKEHQSSFYQAKPKKYRTLRALSAVILTIIAISVTLIGYTSNLAKAAPNSKEKLINKILINDLSFCYENDTIMTPKPDMLTGQNFDRKNIAPLFTSEQGKIKLPNNGFISDDFSGEITCLELFNGTEGQSEIKGLYKAFKDQGASFDIVDMAGANDDAPSLGYTKIVNEDQTICFMIEFKNINIKTNSQSEIIDHIYSAPICYNRMDSAPNIYQYISGIDSITNGNSNEGKCTTDASGQCYLSIENGQSELQPQSPKIDYTLNFNIAPKAINVDNSEGASIEDKIENKVEETLNDFTEDMDEMDPYGNDEYAINFCTTDNCKDNVTLFGPAKPTYAYQYQKGDNSDKAKNFFAGTENYDFTDNDRMTILEYYISKTMDSDPEMYITTSSDACKADDQEWESETYYLKINDGTYEGLWCPLTIPENIKKDKTARYNVIKNSLGERNEWLMGVYFYDTSLNSSSVLERYSELIKKGIEPKGYSVIANNSWSSDQQEGGSDQTQTDPCYNSNSVGWIICPILNMASEAMSKLYENIVEDFLVINPSLVSSENVQGVFDTVINIANTAMIVFLLFVIFSQLTGIGIDNYGIKKTLPKLIVVAILVNVSFILCRLLVDISNILGHSLNDWLAGIQINVPPAVTEEASSSQSAWFNTLFTAVAGGTVIVGGATLVSSISNSSIFAGILLPIIILFLTALFAVFFFFVLLALRQAGVVILIAIAPLAILCYALPNTKKYYDKWLKAFQGLLLLYPICGTLIGGGTFVSKLLLSASDNGMMYFIASLIMVVPFFLIPSILKGSFKAMGNIGATVSGYGRRMRGWSTKKIDSGIRNSERFKNRVELHKQNRAIKQGEKWNKKYGNRINKLSDTKRAILLQRTRAMNAAKTQKAERTIGAYALTGEAGDNIAEMRATASKDAQEYKAYTDQYQNMDRKALTQEYKNALAGNNKERAAASLSALIQQGGITEALTETNDANWSTMDSNVKKRVAQAMANTNVDAFKSYSKYQATGGGADFKNWYSGTIDSTQEAADIAAGAKDTSFAQHLIDNGATAMNNYSKDEVDFVRGHQDLIRNKIETIQGSIQGKNTFGTMLKNVAIHSSDAKTKTISEDIIKNQLANNKIDISNMNIIASDIGNMRGETAQAIDDGLTNLFGGNRTGAEAYLRSELDDARTRAQADSTIYNKTNPLVKEILDI